MDRRDEAYEAVRAWWQAWAEKDLEAIRRLTSDDYVEFHPEGGRATGRGELLQEAARNCRDVSISRWELSAPATRVFEDYVVCSYRFRVSGTQGTRSFDFAGWACDTLTTKTGRLLIASHRGVIEGRLGSSESARRRPAPHP